MPKPYGLKRAGGDPTRLEGAYYPVAAAYGGAVSKGDMVTISGGYISPAAENSTTIFGVVDQAHDAPDSGGSDGQFSVYVITDLSARFRYPCNTGSTAAETHLGTACDVAGAQSIDLTTNQSVLRIVGVDTDNNEVEVQLISAKRV